MLQCSRVVLQLFQVYFRGISIMSQLVSPKQGFEGNSSVKTLGCFKRVSLFLVRATIGTLLYVSLRQLISQLVR